MTLPKLTIDQLIARRDPPEWSAFWYAMRVDSQRSDGDADVRPVRHIRDR